MKESLCEWTTDTWKNFKISQQPEYDDLERVEETLQKVIRNLYS
jgi:hypothetical protein